MIPWRHPTAQDHVRIVDHDLQDDMFVQDLSRKPEKD